MFGLKITFDQRAIGLGGAEIGPEVANHFLSIQRAGTAHRVGFDILVEILVGIEFGAVARQKVNAQSGAVAFEPTPSAPGHRHRMAVDNEEDFPLVLAQQSAQKFHKDGGSEAFLEDHELQLPPVGDGRYKVAAKALAGAQNHRRPTLRTEGSAGRMIGAQPHFVRPENERLLPAGQGPNGRILSPQPRSHRLGILLESPSRRLLRGKAPPRQQPSRRPDRKPHATTLSDEVSHRFAGPKVEGQLQLVRTTVGDEAANLLLLPGMEPTADRTPSPPGAQALCSGLLLSAYPTMNGLAGDPENPGHFALGTARAQGSHRLEADCFLRGWRQRPKILMYHAQKLS